MTIYTGSLFIWSFHRADAFMLWKVVVVVGKACQKERKKKRGTGAVNIPAIKTCLLSFQNSNLLFEKRKCVAPAINHRRGNPKGGWCAHHTHTYKRELPGALYLYERRACSSIGRAESTKWRVAHNNDRRHGNGNRRRYAVARTAATIAVITRQKVYFYQDDVHTHSSSI